MKITKAQLKQIIKEELESALNEGYWSGSGPLSAGYRDVPQSVGDVSLTDFSLEPQIYIAAKAEEDATMGSLDRSYLEELRIAEDATGHYGLQQIYHEAFKVASGE
jgi:hypothetical protein